MQDERKEPMVETEQLVREDYGGEGYEYYPLGEHIVAAPGVCGGRPTFKYTRIEAAGALNLMAAGYTIDQIAQRYEVSNAAVKEAIRLAAARLEDWKIAA
jgi:uncharacterized protein (DUF433 family)